MTTRQPELGEEARCQAFVNAWLPGMGDGFDWQLALHPRKDMGQVFIEEDAAGDIIGLFTITHIDNGPGDWWIFHGAAHPRLWVSIYTVMIARFQALGRAHERLDFSMEGEPASFQRLLRVSGGPDVIRGTEIRPNVWETRFNLIRTSGPEVDAWQRRADAVPRGGRP